MAWRQYNAKQIVNILPEDPDHALDIMSQVCDILEGKPGPNQFWIKCKHFAKAGLAIAAIWAVADKLDLTDSAAKALRGDPLVYNHVTLLTPAIKANQPLKIHVSTLRRRVCSWTWDNFWMQVDPDGDTLISRSEDQGNYVYKMDEPSEYSVIVNPPKDLPDGTYKLLNKAHVLCSHNDSFTEENEPIIFKVRGAN